MDCLIVSKIVDTPVECMNDECINKWDKESYNVVVSSLNEGKTFVFAKCFMEEEAHEEGIVYGYRKESMMATWSMHTKF